MEPNDLFEVELGNVASIISHVARNKVSHLGEFVHDHHDCILSPLIPIEIYNEVHAYIISRPNRYEQWCV